jgi:hypothetical protein
MAIVNPVTPAKRLDPLEALASQVSLEARIDALTRTVEALVNLQAAAMVAPVVARPKAAPKAKSAPKPRPKATHGPKVGEKDINAYRTLWHERVALRKTLGLAGGFAGDTASQDPRMTIIVKKMDSLVAKGVNGFLVGW